MDRQAFLTLTTSTQWLLFAAIALIIFSWVERKKRLLQAGQLLFALLGIFSLWVISSGQIPVQEVIPGQPVPAETKALSFFFGLQIAGLTGLCGLILGFYKASLARIINMALVGLAIFLFFMVYMLQRQ
ncbi:hypothetical protein [Gaoshiqia sp. Z1-71]|uniref:hypothetical protein n=1 Tax=Gaoshiqia hydrogeniformans TaxID=3290090 RepID=UPI003BF8D64D